MRYKSIRIVLLVACALTISAVLDFQSVRASATFAVDSIGDEADSGLADNLCRTVADTCTLRAAIQQANASAGADIVNFAIPGAGVHTIAPATPLPNITDPLTIDGYSQPGASPNTQPTGDNAVLLIELEGSRVAGGISGLTITAGSSSVRGLAINRWLNSAIDIRVSDGNTIVGNFIGTDPAGTVANFAPSLNNGTGVSIAATSDNSIGGTTPGARNIISGNRLNGVSIVSGTQGAAARNIVQGNYIGTDKTGAADLGNGASGVNIDNSPDTLVGGDSLAARNVISGNQNSGIFINSPGAARTRVQGNYIGVDVTGSVALGNGQAGVFIQAAADNSIGGATTAPGAPPGNLISGNGGDGVHIFADGATGNLVAGNLIGTDQSGAARLGNSLNGVTILNADGNTIGGMGAGAGNIISGNGGSGISISGATTTGTAVQGNAIGTDAAGAANLGNAQWGVTINSGASQSLIGGTATGAANMIAFNGTDGVQVTDGTSNAILTNAIFANADLGIDLGVGGVTPNDPDDGDTGGNNLQNFPVLASASSSGSSTTVQGTLSSASNTTFRVEFFASSACNAPAPNDFGEGRVFLGAADVTTDGAGAAPINVTLTTANTTGQFITATATDPANNTSEFSRCTQVTAITPTNTPTSTPAPPTNTPTSTPTKTPVPPTSTPTKTPVPPTSTPALPTNTPTSTPVPPTSIPTKTPVPPTNTPTSTPVPPTSTPPCTPTKTPVPPTSTPAAPTHPGTIGFWRNWRHYYSSSQFQALIDYAKANDSRIYNRDGASPSADDLTITKVDAILNYGSHTSREQQILGQFTALTLNLAVTQLQGSNGIAQKNSDICRRGTVDVSSIAGAATFFGAARPTVAQVMNAVESRWAGQLTANQRDWRFNLDSSAQKDLVIKVLDGINQGAIVISGCPKP